MIAYVLIAVLAALIFLCFPDVVPVVTQAAAEWRRVRVSSTKHLFR